MRAEVQADYGRKVVIDTSPTGDIKLTACPQESSGQRVSAIQVVLGREGALALAALLTVAAKEVRR